MNVEPATTIHETDGNQVTACERCPALCKSRAGIINGRGNERADILFLAEKPGQYDDQRLRAFSGDDGKVLAALMLEAGIDPTEVYMTYAVRCWPKGNRPTTVAEQRDCADHLLADLQWLRPKVVVTLGAKAYNSILKGIWSATIGTTQEFDYGTGKALVVPTFAPGFLLRGNWGLVPLVTAHLEKARALSTGTLGTQPLEDLSCFTCETPEAVETLRDFLLTLDAITVDSETTGLSWMTDEILCLSFSGLIKNAKGVLEPIRMGFTVPLMHKVGEEVVPFFEEWAQTDVVSYIGEILDSPIAKGIQNAQFDIRFFERDEDDACVDDLETVYGWTVNNLRYDPYLLQRLVDENMPANETVMLGLYTDMPYYEEDIKTASKNKHAMAEAPDQMTWDYASSDADGLARLIPPLLKRAQQQDLMWVYDNISIPMVYATWHMTKRGIPVDMDYFALVCERYRQLVTEAREAVKLAAGDVEPFNPNKSVDLQRVLFTDLSLPESGRKTEAAKACFDCDAGDCDKHDSTGKDALLDIKQVLINRGEEPHPFIDAVLSYKTLSKRKSTYVDGGKGDKGMLQFIRPDDAVHPEFGVNKADTGRLSATKPPIQTIPKNVMDPVLGEKNSMRRMFVSPPGTFFMEPDWNQGEVWVMAYESGSEKLLELLLSGQDVHTYVARTLCHIGTSRVFPKESEEPDLTDRDWGAKYNSLRSKAKVFVFGLDYGMTEVGAAQRLRCPIDDAAKLIELFLSQVFPDLRAHFDRVRQTMENGGILINTFGRRGHFGDVKFIRQWGGRRGQIEWEALFRKGVNMPMQSGLNDLHMLAQIAVENDDHLRGRFAIILAVHDSLAGKTPNDNHDFTLDTAWMLKEKMETLARHQVLSDGTKLDWGIPVEISWGRSWGRLEWTLTPSGELVVPKE